MTNLNDLYSISTFGYWESIPSDFEKEFLFGWEIFQSRVNYENERYSFVILQENLEAEIIFFTKKNCSVLIRKNIESTLDDKVVLISKILD